MRTDTQSISIAVPAERAFDLVSNPESLPRWAAAFAREVRRDGEAWLVTTPQGLVRMRYACHRELGVIDYQMTGADGVGSVAHSRVIPAEGGCLYVFTQEQPRGMSDEVFEGLIRALARELRLLESLLEVGTCAA
jgi:hypothetical protein